MGLRAKMENLKTAEWPTPPMWKVMEFLRNECRPKDMISKAQQKGKLMQLRPCEGEDPDKYLTAVIKIEMEHGVKFEEEDKIAQAMNALGPEYGEKLNDVAKTLKEKGEDVTFAALMESAKEKWRVTGKGARMKKEEPVETSLTDANLGANLGRYANHICHHCGKKGHIKRDCDEWKRIKAKMSNIKCDYPGCPGYGHTKERCWEDPRNARFRPRNWTSRINNRETDVVEVFV